MVRLLDIFCGAGGAAMGYHRAGFTDIVGVDNRPQPRYPFAFVRADALEYVVEHGREFDVIHASPPCQAYSCGSLRSGTQDRHPDLIPETRSLLNETGKPWIIENVPGSPLRTWFYLCGSMFGLQLRRHRYFETNWDLPLFIPFPCNHRGRVFSVFGHGSGNRNGRKRPDSGTVAEWQNAMGINWMTRDELSQAIPPAYTEWIARRVLAAS